MVLATTTSLLTLLADPGHVWWRCFERVAPRADRIDVTGVRVLVQTVFALHLERLCLETMTLLYEVVLRFRTLQLDRLMR